MSHSLKGKDVIELHTDKNHKVMYPYNELDTC